MSQSQAYNNAQVSLTDNHAPTRPTDNNDPQSYQNAQVSMTDNHAPTRLAENSSAAPTDNHSPAKPSDPHAPHRSGDGHSPAVPKNVHGTAGAYEAAIVGHDAATYPPGSNPLYPSSHAPRADSDLDVPSTNSWHDDAHKQHHPTGVTNVIGKVEAAIGSILHNEPLKAKGQEKQHAYQEFVATEGAHHQHDKTHIPDNHAAGPTTVGDLSQPSHGVGTIGGGASAPIL